MFVRYPSFLFNFTRKKNIVNSSTNSILLVYVSVRVTKLMRNASQQTTLGSIVH